MKPFPSKNTLHYHKKFARGATKKFVEVMYFLANISGKYLYVTGTCLSFFSIIHFTPETVETLVLW